MPLEVICSNHTAEAGSPRTSCLRPCLDGFWSSPRMETPQPLQAICTICSWKETNEKKDFVLGSCQDLRKYISPLWIKDPEWISLAASFPLLLHTWLILMTVWSRDKGKTDFSERHISFLKREHWVPPHNTESVALESQIQLQGIMCGSDGIQKSWRNSFLWLETA